MPPRFASTGQPAEDEQRTAAIELLALYRRARERAENEGYVVPADVPDPVFARMDGRRTLHGLRPFVLYALDDHIARRIAGLRRRLHDRAMETGKVDDEIGFLCDHLESSLRPVPARRLLALLIVTVPAVALGLISLLRGEESVRNSLVEQLDDASSLVSDLSQRLLTLDISDIPTVLDQIAGRPIKTIVFVVLIVLLAVYLTLRPLVSSFRVKRALLCGEEEHDLRTAGGGAYRLESLVLRPVPREAPLDLIVMALPMLLPLYIGLYIIASAVFSGLTAPKLVAGLVAVGPPAARLAYLHRTARLRAAAARDHDLPATAAPPAPEVTATSPVIAGTAIDRELLDR